MTISMIKIHRVLPILDVPVVHLSEDSLCAYTKWNAMKVQVCVFSCP